MKKGKTVGYQLYLVVFWFKATLTAKVIPWRSVMHMFPGFLTPVQTQLSFQCHRLSVLFSHASAEVRGENMPERKFDTTGCPTRNHEVMNSTQSPLSHPGGA